MGGIVRIDGQMGGMVSRDGWEVEGPELKDQLGDSGMLDIEKCRLRNKDG